MATERLFLGCTYWRCSSLQISLLQCLGVLFWKEKVEKAVYIPFSEPSPISVNVKTSPWMHLPRVIHTAASTGILFKLSTCQGISYTTDTRNLEYLLCWLPWDSGDKLNSSNKSREMVIYLNFGLLTGLLCTVQWGDGIHLTIMNLSCMSSFSCSNQRAEGIFRFIRLKPVLKWAWEVPISARN